MTMPHLMNCDHSDEGWCLDCVKQMHDELSRDAERYRYIRDVLVQCCSVKMDGNHAYHIGTPKVGRGPTFDHAIDMEMRDRPILTQEELNALVRGAGE